MFSDGKGLHFDTYVKLILHLHSTLDSVDTADCVRSYQTFFRTDVTIYFNIPVTIISGHFISLVLLYAYCIYYSLFVSLKKSTSAFSILLISMLSSNIHIPITESP